jgi:hypothetical protein
MIRKNKALAVLPARAVDQTGQFPLERAANRVGLCLQTAFGILQTPQPI